MKESEKNPYQNTSEKIYRWSFYIINIYIVLSFIFVYFEDKSSTVDMFQVVFKFIKDIYYLYVIPIGLKILGEHAPGIVSAFRGGGLPLASSSVEDFASPSPRASSQNQRPKTQSEAFNESTYY